MTATVIPLPRPSRPVCLLSDPRYRQGVTDMLAAVISERRGCQAKIEAAHLAATTLDGLPQDFGAGEV